MAKKKSAKKKASQKKASSKKSTKKKTKKKKASKKNASNNKVDPLAAAKVELHDSVKNAVKAFAHIANANEKEAIEGLLSVAPDSTETHKKLIQRKKKLEKGDTESIATDILTQVRGALKSHKIDFGFGTSESSKTRKSKKK